MATSAPDQKITVDYIGKKSISWVGDEELAGDLSSPTGYSQQTSSTQSSSQQAPSTQSSSQQAPSTQSSSQQAPSTQSSSQQAPSTQSSSQQAPSTQSSSQQAPSTQSSSQQAPSTQSSSQQVPSTQSSGGSQPDPTTDEELRVLFGEYINERIQELQVGGEETDTYAPTAGDEVELANKKRPLYMLLAVVHDTSSSLPAFHMRNWESWKEIYRREDATLSWFFEEQCDTYTRTLNKILKLWDTRAPQTQQPGSTRAKQKATDEGPVTRSKKKQKMQQAEAVPAPVSEQSKEPAATAPIAPAGQTVSDGDSRTPQDKSAQDKVTKWYGNYCVLSNTDSAQGAHIVPVRALARSGRDHSLIARYLAMFWPDTLWATRCAPHNSELTNILPLEGGVHLLFDRYKFAIRPIPHMSDTNPAHLWIQMVWLKDTHQQGGLASGNHDHSKGSVINYRLCSNNTREGHTGRILETLEHGAVFLLQTVDPEEYPLPDKGYLEIQFAAQKLMSGMAGAGPLEDIFRGTPPEGDGSRVPADAPEIPWSWEFLLKEAEKLRVLDEGRAEQWRTAIRAHMYEAEQEAKQRLQELIEEQKWIKRPAAGQYGYEEEPKDSDDTSKGSRMPDTEHDGRG